jgi:hypothetical protein
VAEPLTLAKFNASLAGLTVEIDADSWVIGPVDGRDSLATLIVEFLAQLIEANPALQAYIRLDLGPTGRVRMTELVPALQTAVGHAGVPSG